MDRINQLLQGIPEETEVEAIKAYAANPDNKFEMLNEVDQFFLRVMKIPQYMQRLKCWRFVRVFEPLNNEIEVELIKISKGMKSIKQSRHFRRFEAFSNPSHRLL